MENLVEGCIPAGKECPFVQECGFRTESCPSGNNLKSVPFSCGAARLHNAILNKKKR